MVGIVGIVVVCHTPELARAARDLALEMVSGPSPPIALAAGAAGGEVAGTDAAAVADAIAEVASRDGVLVLLDLGSAVLSAEMGLELLGDPECEVRLSDAPLVEGLTAAVVASAAGAGLEAVEAEARSALLPKQQHLGVSGVSAASGSSEAARVRDASAPDGDHAEVQLWLENPHGLHARPAAEFVRIATGFDAQVRVSNLTLGRGPADAASVISVLALGAEQGHRIRIEGTGPQAAEAVEALRQSARP